MSFENLGKAWSRGGIVGREERPRDRSCHPRSPLQRPHQVTKPPPKLPASLCSEILPVIFFLLYFPMQSAMLCPSYPALLFLHALFCSPLQCLEMPSNGLHPGSPKQTAPASSPTAAEHHLPPTGCPVSSSLDLYLRAIQLKFLHAFVTNKAKVETRFGCCLRLPPPRWSLS